MGDKLMPEGTRVADCVAKLTPKYGKVSAIRICQTATGQSYATGKPPEHKQQDSSGNEE